MKWLFPSLIAVMFNCSNHGTASETTGATHDTDTLLERSIRVADGCEGCDLMYEGIPPLTRLSASTTLSGPQEPGDALEISGTIYQTDGRTPAAHIILYVYQTNRAGLYAPADTQTLAKNHGRLRGWMKTGPDGRYSFRTIRPGSYPNSRALQHIHAIIKESRKSEYWIDDFLFADDPFMPDPRPRFENRGGHGVMELRRDADGVWKGQRDIVLGKNIPNYR